MPGPLRSLYDGSPLQRLVSDARWRGRLATSAARALPSFVILGAQKCGTTALFNYLEQHPRVGRSWRKEVDFFSERYGEGEAWYRAHFDRTSRLAARDAIAGEASPNYLVHPEAPARMAALLPDARLVVLLRDPVARTCSHYNHTVRRGVEPLSFDEALDREPERLAEARRQMAHDPAGGTIAFQRHAYLARSAYAEQLEAWLAHFDREQLLVLRAEDFWDDPAAGYGAVLDHLGLSSFEPAEFARYNYFGPYAVATDEQRERLRTYFEPLNARLYALLGRDMGW